MVRESLLFPAHLLPYRKEFPMARPLFKLFLVVCPVSLVFVFYSYGSKQGAAAPPCTLVKVCADVGALQKRQLKVDVTNNPVFTLNNVANLIEDYSKANPPATSVAFAIVTISDGGVFVVTQGQTVGGSIQPPDGAASTFSFTLKDTSLTYRGSGTMNASVSSVVAIYQ